jgi:hypothetical protein
MEYREKETMSKNMLKSKSIGLSGLTTMTAKIALQFFIAVQACFDQFIHSAGKLNVLNIHNV